jgi:hypothetical protein
MKVKNCIASGHRIYSDGLGGVAGLGAWVGAGLGSGLKFFGM